MILRDTDAWGEGVVREARVARLLGALDEQTRLARVLITVADPLGLKSDAPPLILDSLIETEIEAKPIQDVFRLRRDHVRDKDTVWLMQDGKLEIREVQIVFRDASYAYIQFGLSEGEEVVTTTLATVAQGIPLRKVESVDGDDSGEATAPKAVK